MDKEYSEAVVLRAPHSDLLYQLICLRCLFGAITEQES